VSIALLQCVECGTTSNESAGWRGYRIEDPEDENAEPELGWYCPALLGPGVRGLFIELLGGAPRILLSGVGSNGVH
jgi:hypothetical protein